MEKILLAFVILAELGFFVLAIRSKIEKNTWALRRLALNGLELAVFAVLLLTPVLSLGLRFTLFFILLIFRLIVSGIRYLISRKKTEKKSVVLLIINLIINIMVLSAAIAPAFIFPNYTGLPVSGDHEVAEAKYIMIDQNREDPFEGAGSEREVPVHAFYPKDGGSESAYPLVLFSHGAFGYYQSNMSSYQELASNGYVVLALDHPYHSFFTEKSSGEVVTVDPDFIKNVMYSNEIEDEAEIYRLSSEWADIRIKDVNEVLDEFEAAKQDGSVPANWWIEETSKEEIQEILSMADTEQVGLYGHSLGGATAVTVGRNREEVHAVIDLDGTMLGEQLGYENGEYQYNEEPYPTPLLTIESQLHKDHRNDLGALYVNQYICDHALDAHSVYFKGSAHMNFTDLPLFSPLLASMLGTGTIDSRSCIVQMNEIIKNFFDYNLKGQGELSLQEYYG